MSIDPRTTELVNADIDGELSADERAELDELLADDREARHFRDELGAVCDALDAVPDEEPPPHLKHVIMNSIKSPAQRRPAAETSRSTETFVDSLFASHRVRYALSFALGVVLAFTFAVSDQASQRAFHDVTDLVGTISLPETPTGFSDVDTIRLTMNEIAGTIDLHRAGSILILDFDLVSQGPMDIVAVFGNPDIWFNGFAQLENEGTSIAAETGQVTLRMEGQRRYAVYLRNSSQSAATIQLSFYSDGRLIHEDELVFGE